MKGEAKFTILSGIGYNVYVQDNQVIFNESGPMFGFHRLFAFERPKEINNTPGIWYFVHLDCSSGDIPVSHIVEASKYVNEEFGKSFEPYRGALS